VLQSRKSSEKGHHASGRRTARRVLSAVPVLSSYDCAVGVSRRRRPSRLPGRLSRLPNRLPWAGTPNERFWATQRDALLRDVLARPQVWRMDG